MPIRTTHCGSLFPRGRAAQVRSEARRVERADLGLARRHAGGGLALDAKLGGSVTHLSRSARLNSAYPDITATAREDHAAGGGARQEARWWHGWSSTRRSGRHVVASSVAVQAELGAVLRGPCGGRRHTAATSVTALVELGPALGAASSVATRVKLGAVSSVVPQAELRAASSVVARAELAAVLGHRRFTFELDRGGEIFSEDVHF
jgi:hypothetical protein